MNDRIVDLFGNDDVEAMYQAALAVPLADKIQMAIQLIQTFEKQALALSSYGYYVCFSGGKDSIVLLDIFKRSGCSFKTYYSNVTIDPPEMLWHMKKYYPEVTWINPKKHLIKDAATRSSGMPTRKWRWCCEDYKEQGGNGLFKAIGVRADESLRRKGLWTPFKYLNGSPIVSPILYFTEADVWQHIKSNNLPYPSLYDEGFKRLGCIGCPLGGNKRKEQFKRWPKYELMWKKAAFDWFKTFNSKMKKDGTAYKMATAFETPQEYWNWWMETADDDTDQPDCQMFLW